MKMEFKKMFKQSTGRQGKEEKQKTEGPHRKQKNKMADLSPQVSIIE